MLDGFESAEIETGETTIFARRGGSGPPLLLLHGFPQTHLMWWSLAPRLARRLPTASLISSRVRRVPDRIESSYCVGGPLAIWRQWALDVRGSALDAGHFFPEECPASVRRRWKDSFPTHEPNSAPADCARLAP